MKLWSLVKIGKWEINLIFKSYLTTLKDIFFLINSVPKGWNGRSPEDEQAQRQVSLLSDDQQDVQRGQQDDSSQRRSAQRGVPVHQRRGGVLLRGEITLRATAPLDWWMCCWNFLNQSISCTGLICLPAISQRSLFRLLSAASGHQVPLLGPGGGRLLPERQVVLRWRPHEAVQDCDADTSRQDACHHGQTEGQPDCVNLQLNTRLLCICTRMRWGSAGS